VIHGKTPEVFATSTFIIPIQCRNGVPWLLDSDRVDTPAPGDEAFRHHWLSNFQSTLPRQRRDQEKTLQVETVTGQAMAVCGSRIAAELPLPNVGIASIPHPILGAKYITKI
jgi:hypothetical protein